MLDVLNRYAHGFVVVPVALSCRRAGVFDALRARPLRAEELAAEIGANSGHLQVVLRLLESLGWIDRGGDDRFVARSELDKERLIPNELRSIIDADIDAYLRTGPGGFLAPFIDRARERWRADDPLLADFLDSVLVVPILASLGKHKLLKDLTRTDFAALPPGVAAEVVALFELLGWLEGTKGSYALTAPGEFMLERAMNLGVAASYRPMLAAMDALLRGDAEAVFALDADGRETHVDRAMNVISSGFQHDRYFAEVEQILISIFSREPFSAQPRYVADMGSGDGTFLKRVYETVRDKTPRGKQLASHPLTMIGIDLNKAALEETSKTLGAAGIEHVVVAGDIGNPREAVEALERLGVDPSSVLHIRSFLDHDRPYVPPADGESLRARSGARYLGAYADAKGEALAPAAVVQSLVEHLGRWADVITDHGLILLEVHCQDPRVVRAHLDQTESLYFDAIQGFSHQLLVEADAALMAAAEAGLFPRREHFAKFPAFLPFCRITLNLFERRPYRVRPARRSDLPALLRLERACWPEAMWLPASELERRIDAYALGQWVLEMNGEVVGVVYSQRVASVDRLRDCKFADLPALHDDHGSVVQLLSINVLPEMQHLGLGHQLLDLMLMRSALQGGVRQVAGLTRCKDFRGRSLEEYRAYIARRDESGRPVDPVLRFHHSHGAAFLGPVPDYRPEDVDNLGAGVLLCYDFSAPGTTLRPGAEAGAGTGAPAGIESRLESCLKSLLGPARQRKFAWQRPLRDLGLDSLDLLELRTMLQQTFDLELSPTFFFAHPTPRDIERYLREQRGDGGARPAAGAHPVTGGRAEGARPDAPRGDAARGDAARASRVELANVPRPNLESARKASAAPGEPTLDGPRGPARRGAIAIVGMSGRFPACNSLDAYWELLANARDAVTEVPRSRWNIDDYYSADPDAPGKIATRRGGFLGDPALFDAGFFGISRPEAQLMDPQQRLLLETHWEALENAGIDPGRLREAACGIFVGLYTHDYELLQVEAGGEDLNAYYATGNSASIAAGRLAYFLGTRGPAVTLDTACSSSLVAMHHAMRSLRSGECDVALASGVNLILSPRLSIAFTKAGMLAPDGRCKTFDAAADGYVRSEGCAVVVLKRLEDALRDGDDVLAIVRGSAVNQDGASNGLTAPSMPAQEQLLRLALRDAGLEPRDIDYIEAHGTGTSLGDPVEFQALHNVFHEGRAEPLWLGSVKTNIGHAEAAAGVAGLVKVVLAMRHGFMPAHLHFETPNPHLDLDALPARIPVQGRRWERADRPLRAGISSFGFSGTNAHVIVEQAPSAARTGAARRGRVLPLSAKSPAALRALTERYLAWLEAHPDADLGDVCHTAAAGRAHHAHRLAFAADDARALREALRTGLDRAGRAASADGAPRVAFLFTGQGSQYAGMARELALDEPVFRGALAECRAILADQLEEPLEDLLYPAPGAKSRLDETANTQPALFAVEYALARMFQSWGIEPAAVMGHSVGEYVAACIAGVFGLEDGLRLIAARGRLMQSLPRDGGAMAAVLGPVRAALEAAKAFDDVAVAAYNGPESIVLSGGKRSIEELRARLEGIGAKVVPLAVSHAFHSMLMDPILPAFREIACWVRFSEPRIDFASNLTGELARKEVATPDYWVRHVREPVRFEQGVRALAKCGIDVMLEIGPQPVLSSMGPPCLSGADAERVVWLHSLEQDVSDRQAVAAALGALYERGADIDWSSFYPSSAHRRLALPTYPWQRKRYWFKADEAELDAPAASESLYAVRHVPFSRLDDAAPRPASDDLPAPAALAPVLAAARAEARRAYSTSSVRAAIDAACRDAIVAAFRRIGWEPRVGRRVSAARLVAEHGVLPRFERLLGRMLQILAEDGLLKGTDGELMVVAEPASRAASLAEIAAAAPECDAELKLLRRATASLADVLRGSVDALEVLFPGGDLGDAVAVYTRSPFARVGNEMVLAAVRNIVAALPEGRVLRVLEIGAGTGGTTADLLPLLQADATEYVFTDVSSAFLDRARAAFKRYPFVRYELLDVEKDLESQGFAPHQFDLVIAANVLHATADLGASVERAAALLSPGGLMLLVEGLERTRWIDLVFGLTEGWWRFEDTQRRPDYPLLDRGQWERLLEECGLASAAVEETGQEARRADSPADLFNQGIIAARAPMLVQRQPAAARPSAARPSGAQRRWVLLPDKTGVAEEFARAARAAGEPCEMAASPSALAGLGAASASAAVVDLRALDASTGDASGEAMLGAAAAAGLAAVEAVRSAGEAGTPSLALVTRGARAVRRGEAPSLAASSVSGIANVARTEFPGLDVRSVDLDPEDDARAAAETLRRELAVPAREFRAAYRAGQRFIPVLAPIGARPSELSCAPDGVYLIVGGLGDLGLHTARWLVERGARRVVLAGRTAFPARADWAALESDATAGPKVRMLRALEERGAELKIVSVDVRDRAALRATLDALRADGWAPLRGVVQATAVVSAQLIREVDGAHYREVLGPKVAGTWHLVEELGTEPLDFLLLYSSVGALVGLPGQASYAAANSFVDALAAAAAARGLPAMSVNWCGWRDTGVARTEAGKRSLAELELLGVASLAPEQATALLDAALASGCAQVAAVPAHRDVVDSTRLAGLDPLLARLFAGAAPRQRAEEPKPVAARRGADAELAALPAGQRLERLERLVVGGVAELLDLDPADVDLDRSLGDLGIDSLLGLEFRKLMQNRCGVVLSATLVWNYPTARAVAAHIASRLDGAADEGRAPPTAREAGGSSARGGETGGRGAEETGDSLVLADVESLSEEEALRRLTGQA